MALITSVKSGNWSDPTVWDSGTVPTVGDDVVIASGTTVTIDTDIGEIGSSTSGNVVDALTIQNGATLQWNGNITSNLKLNGNWIVEDGATVDFNGTSTPDYSLIIRYDIYQYGNKVDTLGNTAIWKIQGYDRGVKWTVLTRQHSSIENQIEVKDVWNWQIGDVLDIIGYDKQSDLYTITNIDPVNKIITLDKNLTSDKEKYSIVINQTSNIDIRTESPYGSYQYYFLSSYNNNNIFKNFTIFTNKHPSFTRTDNLIKHPLINVVILNGDGGLNGDYGGSLTFIGCVNYTGTCNFGHIADISNSAINSTAYRNVGNLLSGKINENVYLGFRGGYASEFRQGLYLKNSYIINLSTYGTESDGILIGENLVIQNISNEIQFRAGSKIIGGDIATEGTVNKLRIIGAFTNVDILDVYLDEANISTIDVPENSSLKISTKNGLHKTYTINYKAHNNSPVYYNGNESAEIQSFQPSMFELKSKILVENNTSYKFTPYIMKDSIVSNPPKVQLWKGTTLLTEYQMPNTINTWEQCPVSWYSDFDGFIEIKFVFTSDTGTEKFWLSDESNSFHYWANGYITPVYPKQVLTNETIARTVWENATRTLTDGAFTSSDRAHLLSLQNYDDTQVKQLLNELLDIEEGNWEISNNQMIFYKRDGTELMRFNLLDKNNQPSETDVFKRERV